MTKTESVLLDLIDPLYESLIHPERSRDFLTQLCAHLKCNAAAIALHDLENEFPEVHNAFGMSERLIQEWNGTYGRANPRGPDIRAEVLKNGSSLGVHSMRKAPAAFLELPYVQWLRRNDLYHSVVVAVRAGKSTVASLSLARGESASPFDMTAKTLIRYLVPHLQRAFEIHTRNGMQGTVTQAGKFALDHSDTGVIVVDRQHKVLFTNRSAETILSTGRALRIREGKLVASHFSPAPTFEHLLDAALQPGFGDHAPAGGAMTIRDSQSSPISVVAVPFRPASTGAGHRPCVLVFLIDQAANPMPRTRLLRELFGLSPAECRLCELLHKGVGVRTAADHLTVTTTTARFMLKRIFRKTGSHRQSHLVQLLSRLPSDQ